MEGYKPSSLAAPPLGRGNVGKVLRSARESSSRHIFRVWGCQLELHLSFASPSIMFRVDIFLKYSKGAVTNYKHL